MYEPYEVAQNYVAVNTVRTLKPSYAQHQPFTPEPWAETKDTNEALAVRSVRLWPLQLDKKKRNSHPATTKRI